jgi:hypothetical protein
VTTLDIAGAIASVAGLLVAIWTLTVAKGARKAAQEARESIRLGNAAEEFATLNRMAAEFLGYVENSHTEAAALRARDLVVGVVAAKERWRRFLTDDRIARLEEASLQVGVISRSLMAKEEPPTPTEKQRLLRFSHEVVRVIAEEAGTITLESELRTNAD